jgi:hypothetical protein
VRESLPRAADQYDVCHYGTAVPAVLPLRAELPDAVLPKREALDREALQLKSDSLTYAGVKPHSNGPISEGNKYRWSRAVVTAR